MEDSRLKKFCAAVKGNPAYVKAGIVIGASALCCAALYLADNSNAALRTNGSGQAVIERGNTGEDATQELHVRAGAVEEDVEVRISGRTYTDEELDEAFARAEEDLQEYILEENSGPDEVRSPLDLITEIPGTEIRVSWEMDRYDVIDLQGNIIAEELTETGTVVQLKAILSCEGRQHTCAFGVRVLPPETDSREKLVRAIREAAGKADEENRSEPYMVLPEEAGGQTLVWSKGRENRAYAVLVLGIGAAVMIVVSEREKRKEKERQEIRQMQIDYPRIINKFNLYIRAGMTVRRAWFRIVQDYQKKAGPGGGRKAYDEMAAAMYRIRGGIPEGECYEEFGARCREPAYRRFGLLLSQNLRKGSGGLADLLEREAAEAFEDRKKLAKKLGEEAGTKLMIPMFMMLIIVLIIVTVPAFFSIQI